MCVLLLLAAVLFKQMFGLGVFLYLTLLVPWLSHTTCKSKCTK